MKRQRPVLGAWKQAVRGLWDAVASTVIGFTGGYAATDPRRKIIPQTLWLRSISANELATYSLPRLRALCRKLDRDNATARAIIEGTVAQIVGTGIALEPNTGDPITDARLRQVWMEYLDTCDITGKRSIYDLQSQAWREHCTAGEHLWRLVVLPERADQGLIPLCVLPLECEWLMDGVPPGLGKGITAVSGIELDQWARPTAYHLRNPESGYSGDSERIEAKDIIHGFEHRRALQGRGEPGLTAVIERLWQEGDLIDAELRSAVNCAAQAMTIESDYHDEPNTTTVGTADDPAHAIKVGGVARMLPGESVKAFSHNRPSQAIAAFRRTLRGDQAGGTRTDQRWIDRDYGNFSYSSGRMAALDNERLHGPIREWFGRMTIVGLWNRARPYLCIAAGVSNPKKWGYRLIPDGAPYIDPQKDVAAIKDAINGKLTTLEAEIGKRGGDWKQVQEQLETETQEGDAALIGRIARINLTIAKMKQADPSLDLNWAQVLTAGGANTAPGAYLSAAASAKVIGQDPADDEPLPAPGGDHAG